MNITNIAKMKFEYSKSISEWSVFRIFSVVSELRDRGKKKILFRNVSLFRDNSPQRAAREINLYYRENDSRRSSSIRASRN